MRSFFGKLSRHERVPTFAKAACPWLGAAYMLLLFTGIFGERYQFWSLGIEQFGIEVIPILSACYIASCCVLLGWCVLRVVVFDLIRGATLRREYKYSMPPIGNTVTEIYVYRLCPSAAEPLRFWWEILKFCFFALFLVIFLVGVSQYLGVVDWFHLSKYWLW